MALAAQSPLKQVTSQPPALQLPAPLSKENAPASLAVSSLQSPAALRLLAVTPGRGRVWTFPSLCLGHEVLCHRCHRCVPAPPCAGQRSPAGESEQMSLGRLLLDESSWL